MPESGTGSQQVRETGNTEKDRDHHILPPQEEE